MKHLMYMYMSLYIPIYTLSHDIISGMDVVGIFRRAPATATVHAIKDQFNLGNCLPACLPACLSVCLYMYACLCVCLSIHVFLSVCLSVFGRKSVLYNGTAYRLCMLAGLFSSVSRASVYKAKSRAGVHFFFHFLSITQMIWQWVPPPPPPPHTLTRMGWVWLLQTLLITLLIEELLCVFLSVCLSAHPIHICILLCMRSFTG